MVRTFYENKTDRAKEAFVAASLANTSMTRFEKLNLPHTQDFGVYDLDTKRERAMIEIKCRGISSKEYKTIIISSHKIAGGASYCEVTGTPYLVYFELSDALMFYKYKATDWITENIWVEWGGRSTEPRDNQDCEPVVHLPMKALTLVKGYVHPTPEEIENIQRLQARGDGCRGVPDGLQPDYI